MEGEKTTIVAADETSNEDLVRRFVHRRDSLSAAEQQQAIDVALSVDLTTCSDFSVECLRVLRTEARFDEAVDLALALLQVLEPDQIRLHTNVLRQLAASYFELRHYHRSIECFTQAYDIARSSDDREMVARLTADLGAASAATGDVAGAIARYEEAILLMTDNAELQQEKLRTQVNLASSYLTAGKLEHAKPVYEEAIEILKNAPDSVMLSSCLLNLAITLKGLSDFDSSLATYNSALESAVSINQIHLAIRAHIGRCDLFLQQNRIAEAREAINKASKLLGNKSVEFLRTDVLAHMATVAHAEGDVKTAISGMQKAFNDAQQRNDVVNAIRYGGELSKWYAQINVFEQAFEFQKKVTEFGDTIRERDVERVTELTLLRSRFENERKLVESRDKERNRILHAVLPAHIAKRLVSGETHIANRLPNAGILFADIVGFTTLASTMEPENLVEFLEKLFTGMDEIASRYQCERIKTIGDAYMAMTLPLHEGERYVSRLAKTALDIVAENGIAQKMGIQLRVGLHCGPVVAGVMSGSRLSYDVWGDTVNVASRMEEHSEPGRVLCTEAFADELAPHEFVTTKREPLSVHGKGFLTTYWISST